MPDRASRDPTNKPFVLKTSLPSQQTKTHPTPQSNGSTAAYKTLQSLAIALLTELI
ncbi:hypothetical protein [Bartonella tribocorum]|uniref:hypothetical protein n=1 Tax=Bartonella tribocorum TaxID=85701 RepID=UPI000300DD00|nr:hypothetical protein [Bartonella tribocorum]